MILLINSLRKTPALGGLAGFGISKILGLWSGGRELGCKKHRPGEPTSWRLRPASAECGGPTGRTADHPSKERTSSSGIRMVGPPGPWNKKCLMVFAHKVLAPGPGTGSKATFFDKALSGRLLEHGPQKLDRPFGVHYPADTGFDKDIRRLFEGFLPPADFLQQGLDQVEGNQISPLLTRLHAECLEFIREI